MFVLFLDIQNCRVAFHFWIRFGSVFKAVSAQFFSSYLDARFLTPFFKKKKKRRAARPFPLCFIATMQNPSEAFSTLLPFPLASSLRAAFVVASWCRVPPGPLSSTVLLVDDSHHSLSFIAFWAQVSVGEGPPPSLTAFCWVSRQYACWNP